MIGSKILTNQERALAERFVGKIRISHDTQLANYIITEKDITGDVNPLFFTSRHDLFEYIYANLYYYFNLNKENPLLKKLWEELAKDCDQEHMLY